MEMDHRPALCDWVQVDPQAKQLPVAVGGSARIRIELDSHTGHCVTIVVFPGTELDAGRSSDSRMTLALSLQ